MMFEDPTTIVLDTLHKAAVLYADRQTNKDLSLIDRHSLYQSHLNFLVLDFLEKFVTKAIQEYDVDIIKETVTITIKRKL
jgi:hypothetical protein